MTHRCVESLRPREWESGLALSIAVSGKICEHGRRYGSPEDAAHSASDGCAVDAFHCSTENMADFILGWHCPVSTL
jgi:hypothetical protein